MEKEEYVRPRNVNLAFRVTGEEREMIEKRMAQTGMTNMRAFIVKMALEGKVLVFELDSVDEMVRLLSNATNNINQIARRANSGGSIYAADIDELQARYGQLREQMKEVLRKLSEV